MIIATSLWRKAFRVGHHKFLVNWICDFPNLVLRCFYVFSLATFLVFYPRSSWATKRNLLQLLPRAVHRYNFRNIDKTQDVILLFQFDCSMCIDCFNGFTGFYSTARFRRKVIFGWVFIHYFSFSFYDK